jgi:hypothetical protein
MHEATRYLRRPRPRDPNRMSGAAAAPLRHNTPTASEDDEKALTAQDEMTTAGAPTTEYSRRSWQRNMLLNGKSLHAVHSYSD